MPITQRIIADKAIKFNIFIEILNNLVFSVYIYHNFCEYSEN